MYLESKLSGAVLELRSMATAAYLVVQCALMRHESRGLHYNLDHPGLDPTGAHDTII
jgi:L-aspartate oxidase